VRSRAGLGRESRRWILNAACGRGCAAIALGLAHHARPRLDQIDSRSILSRSRTWIAAVSFEDLSPELPSFVVCRRRKRGNEIVQAPDEQIFGAVTTERCHVLRRCSRQARERGAIEPEVDERVLGAALESRTNVCTLLVTPCDPDSLDRGWRLTLERRWNVGCARVDNRSNVSEWDVGLGWGLGDRRRRNDRRGIGLRRPARRQPGTGSGGGEG
jgi:hypothetical protein